MELWNGGGEGEGGGEREGGGMFGVGERDGIFGEIILEKYFIIWDNLFG